MGFGGVGLLALAICLGISTDRLWVRILCVIYVAAINLQSIFYAVSKAEEGYLVLPLFTLLLGGVIQSVNKAFD